MKVVNCCGADKIKSMCIKHVQKVSSSLNTYKWEYYKSMRTHINQRILSAYLYWNTQYFPFEQQHFCSWSNKSILHIFYCDLDDILSFVFCSIIFNHVYMFAFQHPNPFVYYYYEYYFSTYADFSVYTRRFDNNVPFL